jgi:transcriptional regulator with GAF, ATPase, and Fis domain
MHRRAGSGGKAGKKQRHKRVKARRASKAKGSSSASARDLQEQIAALTRELKEAREHQTASGEILASLTGSVPDAKPVFDAIVRNLQRLFGTHLAVVQVLKDGIVHLAAAGREEYERLARDYPRELDGNTGGGRAIMSKQVLQFAPVLGNAAAPPATQQFARDLGFNSVIFAPMIRGDKVIGAIATSKREPIPFDDKQVALIKAFADQAVIAIENVRLFNETKEALEQQTATSEVLKVISSSPGELEPVFNAMLANTTRICEAKYGNLFLREGKIFRAVAVHSTSHGLF